MTANVIGLIVALVFLIFPLAVLARNHPATRPESATTQPMPSLTELLDALHQVENPRNVAHPIDGLGPFCLHKDFWHDAYEFAGFEPDYTTWVCDDETCRATIRRNWMRYAELEYEHVGTGCGTWADVEKLCRVFNGGPRGHTKRATVKYWNKVKAELNK